MKNAYFLFAFCFTAVVGFLPGRFVYAQAVDQDSITITAYVAPENEVVFSGRTCPSGQVYLLQNGTLAGSAPSLANGIFQISVEDILAGDYVFGLYSIDSENVQSSTTNISVTVSQGTITLVSGILLTPTLKANKTEVERGDTIVISGQSAPTCSVDLDIDNGFILVPLVAGGDGVFFYIFNPSTLLVGTHEVKATATCFGSNSGDSRTIEFELKEKPSGGGTATPDGSDVTSPPGGEVVPPAEEDDGNVTDEDSEDMAQSEGDFCSKTDLNDDGRTNIIDFSILLFWYNKQHVPGQVDFNNDSEVNLTDFSIQVYCWTG